MDTAQWYLQIKAQPGESVRLRNYGAQIGEIANALRAHRNADPDMKGKYRVLVTRDGADAVASFVPAPER